MYFSIKCSEYIQFFASPYPAVTAKPSGPGQDLINMTNLDSKETKRERSHQNVTDREETYKRLLHTMSLNVAHRCVSGGLVHGL